MALTRQYTLTPLRPAYKPELATERPVKLPLGGPWGTGGKFAGGLTIGCVGGSAASAVWTITITGSPTGSLITLTYTADQVYVSATANLVSTNATVAQLQAACDAIWGATNTLVAGTPGSSFTITFQNALANARIGGSIQVSAAFTAGTSPAISIARTTPGSAGAGQFDVYNSAGTNNTPTTARALLKYDWLSTPIGALALGTESGNPGGNALAYRSGFFNVSDLSGFDASALASSGFRQVDGASLTDAGAVIGLGV